jgi:hypothetical protein
MNEPIHNNYIDLSYFLINGIFLCCLPDLGFIKFIDWLALESIFSIHLCHPTQDQVHSKQTIGDAAAVH